MYIHSLICTDFQFPNTSFITFPTAKVINAWWEEKLMVWMARNLGLNLKILTHWGLVMYIYQNFPRHGLQTANRTCRPGARSTNVFFHCNLNLKEISFCSHLRSNKLIATKFCTWYNSCAVVACAKFCCALKASNSITARWIFHRIWIEQKNR